MEQLARSDAIALMEQYHARLEAASSDEQRLHEVFADPPVGMAVHEIDTQGVIRRVNSEELRLLGYSEEQMVGHPVIDFIVMREASARAIGQRIDGERDLKPFPRAFRRADGSAVTMLLVVRVLRDPQGKAAGMRAAMMPVAVAG